MPFSVTRAVPVVGALLFACALTSPSDAQTFETGFADFGSQSSSPIEIEADELEVQDRANRAVFLGNVTVRQDTASLQTARLTVHYAQRALRAPDAGGGRAAEDAVGSTDAQTETGEVNAADAATVEMDDGGAANAAAAPTTPQNQRISKLEADGQVVISADGQSATGDAGTIDFDTRTLSLRGNVTLSQAGNVVTGETLTVNLDTGIARVQSTGRVRVLLNPGAPND